MASQQQQPVFPPPSTPIPVQLPADSSVWDRISTWVSEHKAVVYTIAGVTVAVAAGGVVYYSTNSVSSHPCSVSLLAVNDLGPLELLHRTRNSPEASSGMHKANSMPSSIRNPKTRPRSYQRRRGESVRRLRGRLRLSAMSQRRRRHPLLRPVATTVPKRFPRSLSRPSRPCRSTSANTGLSS